MSIWLLKLAKSRKSIQIHYVIKHSINPTIGKIKHY